MKVLLAGVALVAIGALLALGFWSRCGGLNDSFARRRPEGYRQKRWPTSAVGWVVLVLMGAVSVGVFVLWVRALGLWTAVPEFLVIGLGTHFGSRWVKGGRANW